MVKVALRKKKQPAPKPKQPTAIGKLIRAAGSAGGSYLGGLLGAAPLGGAAGHQLGAMASRWLGFGDYHVAQNSVLLKAADSVPYMHKNDQSIVLRHREFVGTVTSTTDFNVQYELPLNPGMSTFPWLAPIAAKFQEYKFRGVVFHYIPASGAAISGTNSALGTVMLQTTYRSSDSKPSSKIEMLNEYCANEVVPSESCIHPIECDPKQNPFAVQFVRNIPIPAGESVLNYDLGRTFVATQGQQADGNYLGDIWVTYEVELTKPVFASNITQNPVSTFKYTGAVATDWFKTLVSSDDTMGITLGASNTITFPANCGTKFTINIYFSDSNFSAVTWAVGSITNATINFMEATRVLSGSAQIMLSCAVTKTDFSKASVFTLPSMVSPVFATLSQTTTVIGRAG